MSARDNHCLYLDVYPIFLCIYNIKYNYKYIMYIKIYMCIIGILLSYNFLSQEMFLPSVHTLQEYDFQIYVFSNVNVYIIYLRISYNLIFIWWFSVFPVTLYIKHFCKIFMHISIF